MTVERNRSPPVHLFLQLHAGFPSHGGTPKSSKSAYYKRKPIGLWGTHTPPMYHGITNINEKNLRFGEKKLDTSNVNQWFGVYVNYSMGKPMVFGGSNEPIFIHILGHQCIMEPPISGHIWICHGQPAPGDPRHARFVTVTARFVAAPPAFAGRGTDPGAAADRHLEKNRFGGAEWN